MSEQPPSFESEPETDPCKIFENLVAAEEWSVEVEEKVRELLESHRDDMYMLYLNYVESGLVEGGLPEHEQHMFDLLEGAFEEES